MRHPEEESPLLGTSRRAASSTANRRFTNSHPFGLLLISISAISYGLSASLVSMERDIATPLVVASRFLGTFLFNAIGCLILRVDLRVARDNIKLVATRTATGFCSFVCGTYAFQNMPVGEATVIISMAPVFVAIFSMCLLGIRARCSQVVLILLSLGGVVMIVDPDSLASNDGTLPKLNLLAAGAALSQALFKSLSYIFIKKSNNRVHFMAMVFWYSLIASLVTISFIIVTYFSLRAAGKSTAWVMNDVDRADILILSAISFLGFVSQFTLTKSTQIVNTTIISLIRNADILVTMAFQIFYFKVIPCWLQILGMVTMVLCTILLLLTKERQ